MIKNKESITKKVSISKLFFFLTFSSSDFLDEDLDKYTFNDKLTIEKKLSDAVENRKDEEILFNKENEKYFEETYGEKGAELILTGAKETSIHEILAGFEDDKKTTVSFREFITDIFEDEEDEKKEVNFKDDEIQEKFEEIEDMLISGKEHRLYNIAVDYCKKEIKILYLRRPEYEEEQKKNLLNRVKNMKSKLEIILKSLEKI